MRMTGIAMLVTAFALAACGEEQAAQNTSAPATPAPALPDGAGVGRILQA